MTLDYHFKPPLRLTLLSSSKQEWKDRVRDLETLLANSAEGAGWLSAETSDESPGERLELRVFHQAPRVAAKKWLDATLHSVVLVLVDQELLEDPDSVAWLGAVAKHVRSTEDRHHLVPFLAHEGLKDKWFAAGEDFGELQSAYWTALDSETAGRPARLAVEVLSCLIRVLATAIFRRPDWKMRIFLSHAKRDGFQLAQTWRRFLEHDSSLEAFYDAEAIGAGDQWKKVLRQGVESSVLLILRTDEYVRRFWCRQEVHWAATFGVPRVVVEAQNSLLLPANGLRFGAAPTVRLPDGNLMRALYVVQQTQLQALLFRRRVQELKEQEILPEDDARVAVIGVSPTVEAVSHAGRRLAEASSADERWVLYPDPVVEPDLLEALEALATKYDVQLRTPGQILKESRS